MSAPIIDPSHLARTSARLSALTALLPTTIPAESSEVVWEIGSGHGHFLTLYAVIHPKKHCIGVDLLSDRLKRADKKKAAAGATNLEFIKAEAEEMIACLPPWVRFSEVLVLFPDPWPKKRHHKNRLIQRGFLSQLAPKMSPGGRLYFRTDHNSYFDWALKHFSEHPDWTVTPDASWAMEEETVFQKKAGSYQSLVAVVKTPVKAEGPTDPTRPHPPKPR